MDGAGGGGVDDRGWCGPAGVVERGGDRVLGDDVPVAEPAEGSALAVPGEIVVMRHLSARSHHTKNKNPNHNLRW